MSARPCLISVKTRTRGLPHLTILRFCGPLPTWWSTRANCWLMRDSTGCRTCLSLRGRLKPSRIFFSVPVQHGSLLCSVIFPLFLVGFYPMPMGTPYLIVWVQVRRAKPWLKNLSRCWYGGRGSYFLRVSCWPLRSLPFPFGVFGTFSRHFLDV